MVQRASPSPAPPTGKDDGDAVVPLPATTTAQQNTEACEENRPRGDRKSVQFNPLDVSTNEASPTPQGPRGVYSPSSQSRRSASHARDKYRRRRFSCAYASGSPYYSLCRDIIQSHIQDDRALSASHAHLRELGMMHEEVLRIGLYLSVVSRVESAKVAREQTETLPDARLPPVQAAVEKCEGDDQKEIKDNAVLGIDSAHKRQDSCLLPFSEDVMNASRGSPLGVPSSPFLSSLRVFPLQSDLTPQQILGHLDFLRNIPLLDVDIPARMTAMKNVSTLVRFQFEYLVEPLLHDIATYLMDMSPASVSSFGVRDPLSDVSHNTNTANESNDTTRAVDWENIEKKLSQIVTSAWSHADVGSAEPFAEKGSATPRDAVIQAGHAKQLALTALRHTVGSSVWQRVLRTLLNYALTTGPEWETVLRYSLILRLKVMEHYDGCDPGLHRTEMKSRHVPSTAETNTCTGPEGLEAHNEIATIDWEPAQREAVDAVIRDAADDFYSHEEDAMQIRRGLASSAVLEALRAQATREEADRTTGKTAVADTSCTAPRPSISLGDLVQRGGSSGSYDGSTRRSSLDRLSALNEPAQGLLAALLQHAQLENGTAGAGESSFALLAPITEAIAQLTEEARLVDEIAADARATTTSSASVALSSLAPLYDVGASFYLIQGGVLPGVSRPASPLSPYHAPQPQTQQQQEQNRSETAMPSPPWSKSGVVNVVPPIALTSAFANVGANGSADNSNGSLSHSQLSQHGPAWDGVMGRQRHVYTKCAAQAVCVRDALLDQQQDFAVSVTVELVLACVQRLLLELRHHERGNFVAAIRFGRSGSLGGTAQAGAQPAEAKPSPSQAVSTSSKEEEEDGQETNVTAEKDSDERSVRRRRSNTSDAAAREPFAEDSKNAADGKEKEKNKEKDKKTKTSCLSCLS